jgi:hypothetical protein
MMTNPELGTTASAGVARYLVGRHIAGVWTTMTSRVQDLHAHPDVCLLVLIDGVETRVPVGITQSLPDDAKIYAQDGSTENWQTFNEVGYISGANFKRFMWGEIGEATYADRTPLTDPDTGKVYHHINEDGLTGWMMPGETIEVRLATSGNAPSGQCEFDWRVQNGPITLEPGEWKNTTKMTFTGGAGEFATVACNVSHRYNQDVTPQAPRLMLMGTATAPWE